MVMEDICCCCEGGEKSSCMVCGRPLVYFGRTESRVCSICGKEKPADAACEAGHFVCDDCHSAGAEAAIALLLNSRERDPVRLYIECCRLCSVHMHGPEHHCVVPCVLLTAYHNCGGELELEDSLHEAWRRGKKVSGGACGFLGACGAAVGAGIYVSILTGATPLTADAWTLPQEMTMRCLGANVATGGPRCCKRTGRLAIEAAAKFTRERFGVELPVSRPACEFSGMNKECLKERCPFYCGE